MRRVLTLTLLFSLLVILRVSAPSDLIEGSQPKQVGYIMDLLVRDHWLLQYEVTGEVATKPPLYNWIAGGICLLFDTQEEWAIRLPSLLAGIGLLWSLYALGCYYFDDRVAFFAVAACIASHHFSKLVWFARTDMLMACLLSLSILAQVRLDPGRWKPWLIGGLNGLNLLTKGPIGPVLYLVFLALWARDHQLFRSRSAWKKLGIGSAICLSMGACWLWLVWDKPHFQEQVIFWQLGSRLSETSRYRAFLIPVGYLFSRIAPWPILSACGVWLAYKERDRREQVRFVALWGAAFLLVFCLIPAKRHDHLLPVYPPFFLLAGVALSKIIGPVMMPRSRWFMYPLCGTLFLVPFLNPWIDQPAVWGLVAAAFISGAVTLLLYLRNSKSSFIVGLLGLIVMHGIYHHEFHQVGRADYQQMVSFIREVKSRVHDQEHLSVYHSHPLIAYQLGQHEELLTIGDLTEKRPQWVIAPKSKQYEMSRGLNANLVEVARFSLEPRNSQASLYRVDPIGDAARLVESPEKSPLR